LVGWVDFIAQRRRFSAQHMYRVTLPDHERGSSISRSVDAAILRVALWTR